MESTVCSYIKGGSGSVCSGSPWEFNAPDEGYLTSKETELPEMIHSAWKELECPICMEVGLMPIFLNIFHVSHVRADWHFQHKLAQISPIFPI